MAGAALWLLLLRFPVAACTASDHAAAAAVARSEPSPFKDPRNASNALGTIFSAGNGSTGYSDQPQVVIFNASYWLCVVTCSPGHEGQKSQIAASVVSTDQGHSWSDPVSIEPLPPAGNRLAASWVNPLLVGKRVYVFYTFNVFNTTHWPNNNEEISNSNLLGGQFFRYSDSAGASWSDRQQVSIRDSQIDRQNPFNGTVPMGWSVGKPFISTDGTAYFQYTKVGCPPSQRYNCDLIVNYDEAWLYASKDIAAGATQPHFETLPSGDVGLVAHNRTGNESIATTRVFAGPETDSINGSCFRDCPPSPSDPGGCHAKFDPQERVLPHQVCESSGICSHLSRESCGNACTGLGYRLAAVEAGHQCMCGDKLASNSSSALASQRECDSPCTGAVGETCGGKFRAFVFEAKHRSEPPSKPSHHHNPPNSMPAVTGVNSWIAEEGDVVEMGNHTPTHLYYVYRTSDGYLGVGTSTDGGRHFISPSYAEYETSLLNTSGRLKNPRGPITPRRFKNGRYLLLYFNRANGGIEGSRNPYFLSAGTYDAIKGTILWSQPEIILYTKYASSATGNDPIGDKLGYPDLFEDQGTPDGRQYYMTETDKITARIHKFDPVLVEGLFAQGAASGQPRELKPVYDASKPPRHIANPLALLDKQLIDITAGDSLTIEAWVNPVPQGAPARPVLACGETNGTGPLFHFFAPGGRGRALAVLFRGMTELNAHALATEQIAQLGATTSRAHQVVMVVDGDAKIASFLVDGVLLDGSDELGTGFAELAPLINQDGRQSALGHEHVSQDCMVGPDVRHLRVYGSKRGSRQRGYLRTSEVVASFHDGLPL
jgi:hypothetical protein